MSHRLYFTLFSFASLAHAYTYTGRVTAGAYAGRERLTESSAGSTSNDVATASTRFYLRAADIGNQKFEAVADIRDKNDFFGLVDKQRLQLQNTNTAQVRQLSFKYPGSVLFTELGRFPIPEAGAVYTDGGLAGVHLTTDWSAAAFGGWNAKRPEQTYVTHNADSYVYGGHITFAPTYSVGASNLSFDLAAVTNTAAGQTDRFYLYNNSRYQWSPSGKLSLLTYLDFVPNSKVQNATLTFDQDLSNHIFLGATVYSVDVIEYQRIQGVREQLPSSPFREGEGRLAYKFSNQWISTLSYSNGRRIADGLNRQQWFLRNDFSQLFDKHSDLSFGLGYRDNFISKDSFARLRLGYFSTKWEFELAEEFAIEEYKNGAGAFHPLISEFSASHVYDQSIFGTFSVQDIRDERVKILSFFAKVTFRFGSKEIPPVRDGAPPRGHL